MEESPEESSFSAPLEIPAYGAKKVRATKKPGEPIKKGDQIASVSGDTGEETPIYAKSDGVMQPLRAGKGGRYGNGRVSQEGGKYSGPPVAMQ